MNSNGHFSTSDTALAAYLYYKGIPLLEIRNGERAVFLFAQPSDDMIDCFTSGKAPEALYYKAYKTLLRKIAR